MFLGRSWRSIEQREINDVAAGLRLDLFRSRSQTLRVLLLHVFLQIAKAAVAELHGQPMDRPNTCADTLGKRRRGAKGDRTGIVQEALGDATVSRGETLDSLANNIGGCWFCRVHVMSPNRVGPRLAATILLE